MPLSHSAALFNKRVANRITSKMAGWMPGFGIVVHTGRKSHRTYRTPVNVFRRGGKCVIALAYGSETDWVRNILASGGCMLETGGRTIRLGHPRIFHDESRRLMPPHVRLVLGLGHVYDFLELTPEGERDSNSQ